MDNKINIQALNEREFAQAVGVSYALVKKLRQQGVIKGYCRVGRRILYKFPQHVDAFFRQFEQSTPLISRRAFCCQLYK